MYLSVIIPYYNSAAYIYDAIKSVEKSTNIERLEYEIIVVNDGSTESNTKQLLDDLVKKGYKVVSQANRGPAAARNAGIKIARGKYFLFLDSDNKIKETYIHTGIKLLETSTADIVYGNPIFFGDSTTPRFHTRAFDINKIIIQNYIDICCIIKRDACINNGCFDEDRRIIGMEDWEFYIRLFSNGYRIQYIDSEVYYYRILKNSLSQQHDSSHIKEAYAYIYGKHAELVSKSFVWYSNEYDKYTFDQQKPVRAWAKHVYKRYMPLKIRRIVSSLLFS